MVEEEVPWVVEEEVPWVVVGYRVQVVYPAVPWLYHAPHAADCWVHWAHRGGQCTGKTAWATPTLLSLGNLPGRDYPAQTGHASSRDVTGCHRRVWVHSG